MNCEDELFICLLRSLDCVIATILGEALQVNYPPVSSKQTRPTYHILSNREGLLENTYLLQVFFFPLSPGRLWKTCE